MTYISKLKLIMWNITPHREVPPNQNIQSLLDEEDKSGLRLEKMKTNEIQLETNLCLNVILIMKSN